MKKIAFLCTENSARSQIAEAIAKKLYKGNKLEFTSGGTNPGDSVDKKALQVLEEEGILWEGKPKILEEKEKIDVVVTMGCEVICPVVEDAKIISWDIPDPKGKGIEEYRRVLKIIKENVVKLIEREEEDEENSSFSYDISF